MDLKGKRLSLIKKIKSLIGVTPQGKERDADSFASLSGRSTVGLFYPDTNLCMIRHPDGVSDAHVFSIDLELSKVKRPVSGVWNKQGQTGIAFYDVERSVFFFKRILKDGGVDGYIPFGTAQSGMLPVAGDWDGDGVTGIGFFNSSKRMFHLKNVLSDGTADHIFPFGKASQGLIPLAGDWDGDGIATVGLYDPVEGEFMLKNSFSGGPSDIKFKLMNKPEYGLPIAGDWSGTGKTSVGIYDLLTGLFRLFDNLDDQSEYQEFAFGPSSQICIPFSILWTANINK